MTKKYIVKNCPNYFDDIEEWNCSNVDIDVLHCEDCTDCLIKQVIEECKSYEDMSSCYDCTWGNGAAKELLQLFTIEEVE